MLFAVGTENSGMSLFVLEDRLVFDYNFFGEHHVVTSTIAGARGGLRRRACGSGATGAGGTATLVIDGEPCGALELPTVMRVISSVGASIGFDHGSAVSDAYDAPFAFEGTLERLDVQLVSPAAERRGGRRGAHDPVAPVDDRRRDGGLRGRSIARMPPRPTGGRRLAALAVAAASAALLAACGTSVVVLDHDDVVAHRAASRSARSPGTPAPGGRAGPPRARDEGRQRPVRAGHQPAAVRATPERAPGRRRRLRRAGRGLDHPLRRGLPVPRAPRSSATSAPRARSTSGSSRQLDSPLLVHVGGIVPVINNIDRSTLVNVDLGNYPGAQINPPNRVPPYDDFTTTQRDLVAVPHAHDARRRRSSPTRRGRTAVARRPRCTSTGRSPRTSTGGGTRRRGRGCAPTTTATAASPLIQPDLLADGVQNQAQNVVVQVVHITYGPWLENFQGGLEAQAQIAVNSGKAYVFRNGRMIVGTWSARPAHEPDGLHQHPAPGDPARTGAHLGRGLPRRQDRRGHVPHPGLISCRWRRDLGRAATRTAQRLSTTLSAPVSAARLKMSYAFSISKSLKWWVANIEASSWRVATSRRSVGVE